MNALLKTSTDNIIDFPTNNIIDFSVIGDRLFAPEVKVNKDGSISKRRCNKVAGVSSEVYAFTSEEEIKAMIDVFDKRIEEAPDENKRMIASRNKMMFLIGINVGLRASDLAPIKWSFFYKEDGTFKEYYALMPKKTKKHKKFVKIFFNQTVKKAVKNYVEKYPIEDYNDYVFKSREGDSHILESSLGRIIKTAAKEVGIDKNICSHSLRKTWAYTIWHNAEDKNRALVMLQQCLAHSSTMMTMKYIGILDEEKKDMYESVEIGLDFI